MALNRASLDLIKSFEGLRLEAYKDPVGVWTIGYGHTSEAGAPYVSPGLKITAAKAEQILQNDLRQYEAAVNRYIKVPLTANQYGALVSFCYNVGPGNFAGSSVVSYVNQRRFSEVPGRLALWNKAGGRTLKGLTRRRAAEGKLFTSGSSAPAKTTKTSTRTNLWDLLLRFLGFR